MIGRIVKGVGGFYYVYDDGQTYMGNARGILKRHKDMLYVGDVVSYEIREDGDCIITGILKREHTLNRPPVSNLDLLVIVFAAASPAVNHLAVDKMTVICEQMGLDAAICITKSDLVTAEELDQLAGIYRGTYPVLVVNNLTGEGLEDLRELIRGRSAALAGASGVGKSSIINGLLGADHLETGSVSDKTRRGRHTTRHVEIFPLESDTWLYDTPGFTSLDLPQMERTEVRQFIREFREYQGSCYYSDCLHLREPGCAVKEALAEGRIHPIRYQSYQNMIEEVSQWHK
ncbi:MAG: ribosome small subunit-dependent GTPase A [Mogibacterium sp.]|nr:ribosome small subunit-dependent GTPase A [Mogibacterium sp.]